MDNDSKDYGLLTLLVAGGAFLGSALFEGVGIMIDHFSDKVKTTKITTTSIKVLEPINPIYPEDSTVD